jgi:hypothetical protein
MRGHKGDVVSDLAHGSHGKGPSERGRMKISIPSLLRVPCVLRGLIFSHHKGHGPHRNAGARLRMRGHKGDAISDLAHGSHGKGPSERGRMKVPIPSPLRAPCVLRGLIFSYHKGHGPPQNAGAQRRRDLSFSSRIPWKGRFRASKKTPGV